MQIRETPLSPQECTMAGNALVFEITSDEAEAIAFELDLKFAALSNALNDATTNSEVEFIVLRVTRVKD